MNHLEVSFSNNGYVKRCLIFMLYIIVIALAFLSQAIAMFFTLLAGYYTNTGSLKGAFLDAQGMLILMDKNIQLLTLLIPFAVSLFVLILLIRFIHNRTFSETVNGTKKIRWERILFSFGLWFSIMAILTLISLILSPENTMLQFDLSKFIPLIIISIILIPLQTTFEEIMMRGYLAQGIALVTRCRWISFLFPAIIFAILHIGNPEITKHGVGIMLASYFAMAAIWGITSILDDGIELSIGIHAANNLFISLFTTQQGAAFETYAVFEIVETNPYIALLELVLMGTLVIFICYRKYKWSFGTFNKKIEKPHQATSSIH